MTINYPTSLDNFTNPTPTNNLNTPTVLHSTQHSDLNDAVEALQAKVGIDSSLVVTSLDYKINALTASITGLVPYTGATGNVDLGIHSLTAASFVGALTGNASTATKLVTARTISITGDLAYTSPSFDGSTNITAAGTLATVNSNVGSFGSATQGIIATIDGKGRTTAAANVTITPAVGSITGLGTGVATALTVNVGTDGAFVVRGGALGTPSSGVATNLTGTASGLTSGNVTTNANLTGVITSVGNATSIASQTGTGTKFVVDNTPTLITPLLGTPTSGTLTNCTGLNANTGLTGTTLVSSVVTSSLTSVGTLTGLICNGRLAAGTTAFLTDVTAYIHHNAGVGGVASAMTVDGYGAGAGYGLWMNPINDNSGLVHIRFMQSNNSTEVGTITYNGTGINYNTTSDYRLKSDINLIDFEDSIDKINRLKPKSYRMGKNNVLTRGFIAHEVAEAGFEECVSGEKDALDEWGAPKLQSMDVKGMIPDMINTIQYLLSELDRVKSFISI